MSRDRLAVTCSGVTKTYRSAAGSVEALHALDATLPAGQLSALVGPSGCGKSTLLRLIAGLDGADAGAIVTGNVLVAALSGRRLRTYRRLTVAYVAQRGAANLIPHLSLRQQLGAGEETLVEQLGLTRRLDARAGQLSGGEQARAALAVALMRGTPVLLADEPTAELDRAAAEKVLEALQTAAASGCTIVVATHDPELVASAAVTLDLAGSQRPAATVGERSGPDVQAGPGVVVRGVSKRYRGTHAVDGASLDLARAELGVLLGRSGSGKSTLLMAIGGWFRPDEGSVELNGRAQAGPPAWRSVAYLPQRFGLLPELSIAENIALPLRLDGGDDAGRVGALLEQLQLVELRLRAPSETSIGQQQRAALARALVQRSPVLLADEPTSHQDAASAELVWSALASARDEGTAVLVATNDPAAAARGDRVWEIADGRISALD